MCFASAEGDFQMGFVRHTFFRGYDKRLTSAFISNQHPLFSGNIFEFMLNTPRPAFYGVYGQNSTKICFKYNIFDTIRRVFFRGSMASNIPLGLDAGSPSSSFGWSSFFVLFFVFGRGDYCCLFFIVYFFSLFFCLFVLFFLYSCCCPISDLHKVLWYTYFSLSGMISHY